MQNTASPREPTLSNAPPYKSALPPRRGFQRLSARAPSSGDRAPERARSEQLDPARGAIGGEQALGPGTQGSRPDAAPTCAQPPRAVSACGQRAGLGRGGRQCHLKVS